MNTTLGLTQIRTVRRHLNRRPRLDFAEWAERYLDNADGTRFRFRPYQRLAGRAMFDPSVQRVVLRWSSGAGKTYLLGAGFLFGVHQLRESQAVMLPNVLDAEDWVKNEFMPIHDATGAVADIGFAKGGDLRRQKVWKNGATLSALGANSASRLRRLQAGVLYADEVDGIRSEESDEGDKLGIFWMRGRGRKRVHQWASSYPSVKGSSKIDSLMDEGILLRWVSECLECGHKWEMTTADLFVPNGNIEDASFQCPGCKRLLDDGQRKSMSEDAEWTTEDGRVVTSPLPGVSMNFHLNAMAHVGPFDASYSSYLHYLAAKRHEAETSENPEKSKRVFANTIDAVSYEPPHEEKPDAAAVLDRRENYDPDVSIPTGVLVIVGGVDVQKNRIELEFVGHGLNRETWGLGYQVIRGAPTGAEVWKALDAALDKEFSHPSGQKLKARVVGVDSGHWQDQVLAFTKARRRRGVHGVKGVKEGAIVVRPVHRTQPKVGTNEAKETLMARLALEPFSDGAFPHGYMHFPATPDYNEVYFAQLTAENSTLKMGKDGNLHQYFECPPGTRNEALDCRVYALWAFLVGGFKMAVENRRLNGGPEKKPEKKGPRKNFATGF